VFKRTPVGFLATAVAFSILAGAQWVAVLLLLVAALANPEPARTAAVSHHSPGMSFDLRPLIDEGRPSILRAQGIAVAAAVPMALVIGTRNRRWPLRYISIGSLR